MKVLKPHSPEWFEELQKVDPHQATMTRRLMSFAGREDICSTCGEEDAPAYVILSAQFPGTIRLCTGCVRIREKFYGESFEPFVE